jgi:hypothetical protein
MAQVEIIDLDAALPPDKQVKLGGNIYKLPGDLPVELYLRVQRASKTLGDESSIEDLRDAVIELFQSRDAKITKLPADFGLGQLITLLVQVYMPPAEPDPTPRRAGTASSSKQRGRSRS